MKSLMELSGVVAVLDRDNIDTDQIIPKDYLKSIERTGFERGLFAYWRYTETGEDNLAFELNKPECKEASILLTGNNFGCGSSREHAVWALMQYGFKAVIASHVGSHPAFADIFRSNATKNGLLTLELAKDDVLGLIDLRQKDPLSRMVIDLQGQNLIYGSLQKKFFLDPLIKERLLKGLDDIDITLLHEKAINAFERRHMDQMNWSKKT